MNFLSNIISKTKDAADKALTNASEIFESKAEGKIVWVPLEKIVIDSEIKAIFEQNENEINNISEDMKANGYNPANPVTLSQDNVLVEGHTRYMAATKSGVKKVAAVYRHFESHKEMVEYAYKQQLHRRNLSEQDLFKAYAQLRELTDADGKKAKTDVQIAEELHVSPRQIGKMKEVEKKASPEVLSAFSNGEITLNQAYNQMKEELKPAEEKKTEAAVEVEVVPTVVSSETVEKEAEPEPKAKKVQKEKPAFEKLSLKFKPEDFILVKDAAEAANVSVSEYVMNLVMSSVQTVSETEIA